MPDSPQRKPRKQTRQRADVLLVERGLVESREQAQALIMAGAVLSPAGPVQKAGTFLPPDTPLELRERLPYVSRGGVKLAHALDAWTQPHAIRLNGITALDVGASTGGFTDCLPQHGAAAVAAIDVGRNQLHERLRADPRVASFERTDVRGVEVAAVGGPAPLVVADVSFISLRLVAADLRRLATGDIVALVKPQFEAGRADAGRGRGVIRDPEVWRRTVLGVGGALADAGAAIMGVMVSPLTGAEGNVEFLLHADARPGADGLADLDACVELAVAEAARREGV